jgi:hypothetical protein
MDALTPRQRYLRRYNALKNERSSWIEHWRELCDYIQPRRSRFLSTDTQSAGQKRNQHIINGVATWAARTLASGMMAGITSPARPWFRLTTPDPDLAEYGAVKEWLFVCEERLRLAFQRSNIYNALHQVYADLGTPGTAVLHIEEDSEDLIRGYVFPVGSYSLANSSRMRVDTIYRELSLSAAQLVEQFTLERCSDKVRRAYEGGMLDQRFDVLHIIEPNRDVKPGRAGPEGMPVRSCWVERGASEDTPPLREGGFEEFPAMCPRWTVTGEDVYGSSPAMEALGDIRALQVLERKKGQMVAKIVEPPMRAPTALRGQTASLLPGDTTFVDAISPAQMFAPAMEIPPMAVQVVGAEIREHEARIRTAFFADLWLSLTQGDSGQMTAREVVERHEEKMLQLGPVMERLQDELLDPMIDRVFGILLRHGDVPPPPQEMQGQEVRVEYLSILAQAQKLVGTSAVERLASFVGNLAAVRPDVLDKVNFDELVDQYSGMLGVPPQVVRTDEEVAQTRQAKAQAAQAQMQQQQATTAVQGAKVLSETDTGGDNALTRMLSNLGGTAGTGTGRA